MTPFRLFRQFKISGNYVNRMYVYNYLKGQNMAPAVLNVTYEYYEQSCVLPKGSKASDYISVGRSVKLLPVLASTVILGFRSRRGI
jgi:hypothetical protein